MGGMKISTMQLRDQEKQQHSQAKRRVEIVMQTLILRINKSGTMEGGEFILRI